MPVIPNPGSPGALFWHAGNLQPSLLLLLPLFPSLPLFPLFPLFPSFPSLPLFPLLLLLLFTGVATLTGGATFSTGEA
jgi:hypothetical protein